MDGCKATLGVIAKPKYQRRQASDGTLLNEVNENLLVLPHSKVDRLEIATSGVVFLFDNNDGPREISCIGDSDDNAMSGSKGTSNRNLWKFFPLNENIAGESSMSPW